MAIKSNYDNLPLSKLTLEGSHFNIDDIKVMKVFNDRQDTVIKEMLNKQKKSIFLSLDNLTLRVEELNTMAKENRGLIKDLQNRLTEVEIKLKEHLGKNGGPFLDKVA
jgi:hypothetical protein